MFTFNKSLTILKIKAFKIVSDLLKETFENVLLGKRCTCEVVSGEGENVKKASNGSGRKEGGGKLKEVVYCAVKVIEVFRRKGLTFKIVLIVKRLVESDVVT